MQSKGLWNLIDLGSNSGSSIFKLFRLQEMDSFSFKFGFSILTLSIPFPEWLLSRFEKSCEKGLAQINGRSYDLIIIGQLQVNFCANSEEAVTTHRVVGTEATVSERDPGESGEMHS